MKHLVVISPFGGFDKGERIADPDRIGEILAGENAHHVVVGVEAEKSETTNAERD